MEEVKGLTEDTDRGLVGGCCVSYNQEVPRRIFFSRFTLPETNIAPENGPSQ